MMTTITERTIGRDRRVFLGNLLKGTYGDKLYVYVHYHPMEIVLMGFPFHGTLPFYGEVKKRSRVTLCKEVLAKAGITPGDKVFVLKDRGGLIKIRSSKV